jgi:hypothetical protein
MTAATSIEAVTVVTRRVAPSAPAREVAPQHPMLHRQQEIATRSSFLQHRQKRLSDGEHNAEYTLTPLTGSASMHAGEGIVRTYTQ